MKTSSKVLDPEEEEPEPKGDSTDDDDIGAQDEYDDDAKDDDANAKDDDPNKDEQGAPPRNALRSLEESLSLRSDTIVLFSGTQERMNERCGGMAD